MKTGLTGRRGRTEGAMRVPWWKKVLRALRVSVRPGKTLKEPIKEVWIKGRIEF